MFKVIHCQNIYFAALNTPRPEHVDTSELKITDMGNDLNCDAREET